ncbi:helix-turn-helix domain-containing protein [Pediococcus inopinatus]|uniref:helix-turn-helix domain-containing protein n=1 Tax=Pediococcus TaxID=1253 RepID=UPI002B25A13C|nr:helix-turn-helix transcriptional regulator [Pediococcus inopinatus]WPC18226.1 helix-turn-helix domain-containing protein [Pediococcus inopinatus]
MTFADQLIRQRKRAGYTRSALAKELEVSPDLITEWEHGEAEPNLDDLVKLHSIYQISLDELVLSAKPYKTVSASKWLNQFDRALKKK